jgi:hypothetical protein
MTVNVYAGPGTSAYASTRFTATVNGVTSYVYGLTRTTALQSVAWTFGQSVEMSWVKFTADETATVTITRLAGAITSVVVYPGGIATPVVAGSTVTMAVPTGTDLRVEINGDRANVIHVFARPLPRSIGTVTNWTAVTARTISSIDTGTNVVTVGAAHGWAAGQRLAIATTGTLPAVTGDALSIHEPVYVLSPSGATLQLARTPGGAAIDFTGSGTGTLTLKPANWTSGALYFGAGVHVITRLFRLEANTRVYIDANAVVIGSFDWRGVTGTGPIVEGVGTLLGDFATSEQVQTITDFTTKTGYAMFFGYNLVNFTYNTEVQGITIARTPFYTDFVAVNRYIGVQVITPWFYECNGLQLCGKPGSDFSGFIQDCFSFCGDDNLTLGEQVTDFSITVTGCFLVTMANSNIHLNYWPQPNQTTTAVFDEIDFVHIGVVDNPDSIAFPVYGGNCHIKAWSDGFIGQEDFGRFNVTFTRLRFWGPHASRWLMLANEDYPFDDYDDAQSRDQRGRIANWSFDDVTHEQVPGQIGVITGFDFYSTPHDIAFRNVRFAGELMTAANFFDYFETNAYPYNLTAEGQPVVTAVDISNTALDLIGHAKRITSLAPPDGSAEAAVCAEHYTDCVNELLDSHDWNLATVKRALVARPTSDDPAWEYCYELPAGLLRVISIIPADATDNHYTATAAVPVDYEIHADTSDVVRIYTDLEDAWVRFVKYVTNPNLFSPTFLEALQWKLASRIAGPIIKGTEGAAERDRCTGQYMMAMAKATTRDARQQRREAQKTIASWHQGR